MNVKKATNSYVFNRTRQAFLASDLRLADTHISRFRGLIGHSVSTFRSGACLWIVPSRGVHTLFMRMPIDVVYLDDDHLVIHVEENLAPWRFAPVITQAVSVLELPAHTVYETGTQIGDNIEICFETEESAVAS